MNIHRSRDMQDLYNKVRKTLKEENRLTQDIKDIKILYRNAIAGERESLKSAGIEKSCKVTVVYEMNEGSSLVAMAD